MRKLKFLFILLFAYACGNNEQNSLLNQTDKYHVDLIHEKAVGYPDQTQLSIGIITNGKVDLLGLKKESTKILAISNHHNIFEIGSITKVFTSTLLAKFVIDNKLQLNDEISQYIETPLLGNPKISLVQLANHTSGLPRLPTNFDPSANPENPYKDYGEEKLTAYLSESLILSEKGENYYAYSNLGMGLLGYVLTEITGESYESLIQRDIFFKYGMHNSTTDHTKSKGLLVNGLNNVGNNTPNWELSALVGAGGILSSVEDLTKFMLAQFDNTNEELALTRAKTLTIDHISDFGLGWEIINRKSGDTWYKHNGRTGGYTSVMIIDIKNKSGIVILSNISAYSSQSATINDLGFKLMKTIKTR